MQTLPWLSETTIRNRLLLIQWKRANDPDRFLPNPFGSGYLTRDERWREAAAVYSRALFHRWAQL